MLLPTIQVVADGVPDQLYKCKITLKYNYSKNTEAQVF